LRGDYDPLPGSDHVVAFRRAFGDRSLLVFAARFPYIKTGGAEPWAIGAGVWGRERHRVPYAGVYRSVFHGGRLDVGRDVALAEIFADLPVAAFLSEGPRADAPKSSRREPLSSRKGHRS